MGELYARLFVLGACGLAINYGVIAEVIVAVVSAIWLIAFLSPEPSSGKTRALGVSNSLVPRPIEAINVTPAYLFRKVGSSDGLPTQLQTAPIRTSQMGRRP